MSNEQETTSSEFWAKVELMGHGLTAGIVSRPEAWGGLIRVDVPDEKGDFVTEMYNIAAIYAIKPVSEEIARAYAKPARGVIAYDTPIVSRDAHNAAIREADIELFKLRRELDELRKRLVQVNQLPSGQAEDDDPYDYPARERDDV